MASIKVEFKVSHTKEELSKDKSSFLFFFLCSSVRLDMINFSQLTSWTGKKTTVKWEFLLCEAA